MNNLKLFFAFILVLLSFLCHSQDILLLKNGEEIESKVIEIELEIVKYYEYDYQDGPIRNVSKDDLFMIIYENGRRETFVKSINVSVSQTTDKSTSPTKSNYSNSNLPTSKVTLEYTGKKLMLDGAIRVYWDTEDIYTGFWSVEEFQGEEVGRGGFKRGFSIDVQASPGVYSYIMLTGKKGTGMVFCRGKITIPEANTAYLATFKYNNLIGQMKLKEMKEL